MNEIFLNFPKKLFINNEFHNPKNNKYFKCINPSNENTISKIPESTFEDVVSAVKSAHEAFNGHWRNLNFNL